MFTLVDKTLLDRAARLVNDKARTLRQAHQKPDTGWNGSKEDRAAKEVYDRLLRDERDLRLLGTRLCQHFGVKAERKGKPELPAAGAMVKDAPLEPSLGEQAQLGVLGGVGADLQGAGHG